MKIIIFDLDGTLISVGSAAKRAFHAAFDRVFGRAPNEEGVNIHGSTDPNIYRDVAVATFGREMDASELEEVRSFYLQFLSDEIDREPAYRVMSGVPELLTRLSASSDAVLGLQTGNWECAVALKLRPSNLDHFFRFGGFGSDESDRSKIVRVAISRAQRLVSRPIVPEDVIVIGDSPQDIHAGKANGGTTIAVATGIYNFNRLRAENPTFVFEDLSDTNAVISTLGLS